MLKIHQLFFLNVLGLFVAALFVASLISYHTLKSMIIHDSEERLIENINLLQPLLINTDDFDRFVAQASDKTALRVTIIDAEGEVIAESGADKKSMENHSGRVEIMQAMSQPYGVTVRYSNTVKTDFIYVAHKITTPIHDPATPCHTTKLRHTIPSLTHRICGQPAPGNRSGSAFLNSGISG